MVAAVPTVETILMVSTVSYVRPTTTGERTSVSVADVTLQVSASLTVKTLRVIEYVDSWEFSRSSPPSSHPHPDFFFLIIFVFKTLLLDELSPQLFYSVKISEQIKT